jgi:hypothetical protein
MLFKRAILEARCPTLLLLDQDKLPSVYKPETCFYVCDRQFSWEEARREVPMAIACAFDNSEKARPVEGHLKELGFRHIEAGGYHNAPWCIVAKNDRFVIETQTWERTSRRDSLPSPAATPKVRKIEGVRVHRG